MVFYSTDCNIGVALSVAAPKSSGSPTFDEWLRTFDPSTAAVRYFICNGYIILLDIKKNLEVNLMNERAYLPFYI